MAFPAFVAQSLFAEDTPTASLVVPLAVPVLDGDLWILAAIDQVAAPLVAPPLWNEFPWSPLAAAGPSWAPPTKIFLTSGSTWNVPADWNPDSNSIEVVARGGDGGALVATTGGGGGGGGAYSRVNNLTLTPAASINYSLADALGAYFNGANYAASIVAAARGENGVDGGAGGSGGQASAGIGTVKHNGGSGGSAGSANYTAGGGGGAAGPDEDGSGGGDGASGSPQGGGGGASNGGGNGQPGDAGGAGGSPNGGNGSSNNDANGGTTDDVFDATHGLGGGGGGSGGAGYQGAGPLNADPLYGGYGGGAGGSTSAFNATGGDALIVITYRPLAPALRVRGFWKQVAGDGAGDITLTKSGAAAWLGGIYAFTDCFPFGPILTSDGAANASSGTAAIAGLNLALADSLLFWCLGDNQTYTAPSGFDALSQDTGGGWIFGAATKEFPDPGVTGAVTATLDAASPSAVGLIAIRASSVYLTPLTLNGGIVGTAYSTPDLVGAGGTPDYSYLQVGGALPPGIIMTFGHFPGQGPIRKVRFTGTPTTPGVYGFTVRVIDSAAATYDQPYTLIVNPGDVALVGQAGTGALGSFGSRRSLDVVGNAAAGALGTLGSLRTLALLGHGAASALGLLAPSATHAISGNAATAALGAFTAGIGTDLTGQAGVGVLGAFSSSRTVALPGIAATGALGRLWPPFTSDPDFVVRYVYRGNTVRYNPWRGGGTDEEGT